MLHASSICEPMARGKSSSSFLRLSPPLIDFTMQVRLESLGSCLMFAAALTSVVAMLVSKRLDAGLVGLTMSYVISVTGSLNWAVRSASEVEQNIIS